MSSGIGDGAPQFNDEIVCKLERLQIGAIDRFGEVHRIGFVRGQIPYLRESIENESGEIFMRQPHTRCM